MEEWSQIRLRKTLSWPGLQWEKGLNSLAHNCNGNRQWAFSWGVNTMKQHSFCFLFPHCFFSSNNPSLPDVLTVTQRRVQRVVRHNQKMPVCEGRCSVETSKWFKRRSAPNVKGKKNEEIQEERSVFLQMNGCVGGWATRGGRRTVWYFWHCCQPRRV